MADAEQELAGLRDTVLELAGQIAVVAADQVGPAAGTAVRNVIADASRHEYNVVVCGEFKRGKSSLLNAIIGRQQLFPTGETLTTATLMMVRWGAQERAIARIRTADGDEIEEEVGLDDLARYVAAADGSEAYRVGQVDVRLPDPRLESGVVLVDTPGIGGIDEMHAAITEAQLPGADAVILVLSAVRPATVSELDFARRALAAEPAAIIALTMADKIIDVDDHVRRARERVATYLNVPPGDLTVLPVSSPEAWAGRLTGDDARLAASGLPTLEHRIWTTLLSQAITRRLRGAAGALLQRLAEASAPIASELTALAGPAELEQVLAELDEDERQAIAASRTLADEGTFQQEFTDRVDGIEQLFRDRIDQVIQRIEAATAEDAAPPSPQQLALLARAATAAGPQAFAALKVGVSGLAAEWQTRIRTRLRVLDLSPQDGLQIPLPPQPIRERPDFSETVTSGAVAAGTTSTAVAPLTTAIGTLIGGPTGAVFGALTGAVAGLASFFGGVIEQFRRTNARAQARQLREYREQVLATLRDHRANTLSLLEETRQRLLQNLKLQLRTLNRSQLEAIDQARQRVQVSARATAERRAAREATLREQRDLIAGHAAGLHAVLRTLAEIDARVRPGDGAP